MQNLNLTDSFGSPLGPSLAHPFGVDPLGEDVMSRVIYGTRVALEVGIIGTAISTVIGVAVGMLAGFYRGWVDTLLSRLMDVVLSIPILLLGLGLGAACSVHGCVERADPAGPRRRSSSSSPSPPGPMSARIVRGLVLSMREREFVEASRALGASNLRIMFREILPNLTAPIIVYASLLIPTNILLEAALSFLGVGIRPPTASWGQMIAGGHADLQHRMVVHGLSRRRAAADGAGLQSARRRAAGRPEPEERPMRASVYTKQEATE